MHAYALQEQQLALMLEPTHDCVRGGRLAVSVVNARHGAVAATAIAATITPAPSPSHSPQPRVGGVGTLASVPPPSSDWEGREGGEGGGGGGERGERETRGECGVAMERAECAKGEKGREGKGREGGDEGVASPTTAAFTIPNAYATIPTAVSLTLHAPSPPPPPSPSPLSACEVPVKARSPQAWMDDIPAEKFDPLLVSH